MRRKAWPWGFGAVLTGVTLFGVLVPKRKTPFQEGYGFNLASETTTVERGYAFNESIYASFATTAVTESRIRSGVGIGPTNSAKDFRAWSVPEGQVHLLGEPSWRLALWPEGERCVVVTMSHRPATPLERLCSLVGIKP